MFYYKSKQNTSALGIRERERNIQDLTAVDYYRLTQNENFCERISVVTVSLHLNIIISTRDHSKKSELLIRFLHVCIGSANKLHSSPQIKV